VIKQRDNRWWVVVYAGRDPLTGRKRQNAELATYVVEKGKPLLTLAE
jgi:hypothetical protein